jgi:AbiV family abortive infection protein
MSIDLTKFSESGGACIDNAGRLLVDAEYCTNSSTGFALALLAQEECAKAFVLALVAHGVIPWSSEIKRSLYVHNCKHVLLIVLEWLSTKHAVREAAWLNSETQPPVSSTHIPAEVAKAMNVYRHEMLEDQKRNLDSPRPEWNGEARKIARGKRDRKKQDALYIGVGKDGQVTSGPPASLDHFEAELGRAKEIINLAKYAMYPVCFKFPEYEHVTDLFHSMFRDLAPEYNKTLEEEVFPSGIPGVVFVRSTITVADIPDEADDIETRLV